MKRSLTVDLKVGLKRVCNDAAAWKSKLSKDEACRI